MSTRSKIGILRKDGTVDHVYAHWDGYPEHNGVILYNEYSNINKKESNIYFFVLDTKGNPSGSLAYIYNLALLLHNEGYKVSMLYQEQEEFVGVESWLGEKYASIPHYALMEQSWSLLQKADTSLTVC